ncbi:hypothetical protein PRIPAC_85870 [Pristionchus pacificus]|uniref:Uncharacterized protein n=1 Tax=Pristionchus pacificus TaxID=54126 RepID=A0A454XKC8_PRIPA|nr:hypothetical protein PRIPAC_85870 [Pristionchus pacificus]|eukprot:PDM69083.1 hypothetical protein PRIPAC_47385 [Pristionchus pacificus]
MVADTSNYTALLTAQCGLILVALLIFFFTLRVITSFGAIHGNCKFFLSFVAVGQFSVILAHILKVGFWFTVEDYDRFALYQQPFFKAVQPFNEFGYFLVDCNNFLLIIERTIACTRLKSSYEEAGTHWTVVLISEALCIAISAYTAYLIHFQGQVVASAIIALAVEFISVILLIICYLYSKRAYANLEDVGSRYQMREVEHITRALFPACLITVLLRAFVTTMALFANAFASLFPTYIIFMAAYHCIQTINSAQYGLVIILIHESMRLKAKGMLHCLCGRERYAVSARISDLDKQKDGQGAAYFDQLKTIWD